MKRFFGDDGGSFLHQNVAKKVSNMNKKIKKRLVRKYEQKDACISDAGYVRFHEW